MSPALPRSPMRVRRCSKALCANGWVKQQGPMTRMSQQKCGHDVLRICITCCAWKMQSKPALATACQISFLCGVPHVWKAMRLGKLFIWAESRAWGSSVSPCSTVAVANEFWNTRSTWTRMVGHTCHPASLFVLTRAPLVGRVSRWLFRPSACVATTAMTRGTESGTTSRPRDIGHECAMRSISGRSFSWPASVNTEGVEKQFFLRQCFFPGHVQCDLP